MLFYPEIYVLENGFRSFYINKREYCDPTVYVSMKDDIYKKEMKEKCLELTHNWKSLGVKISL